MFKFLYLCRENARKMRSLHQLIFRSDKAPNIIWSQICNDIFEVVLSIHCYKLVMFASLCFGQFSGIKSLVHAQIRSNSAQIEFVQNFFLAFGRHFSRRHMIPNLKQEKKIVLNFGAKFSRAKKRAKIQNKIRNDIKVFTLF